MQRTVFNEDHDAFRKTIHDFIAKEVAPVHHEWEGEGHPPRDFYRRLGELGVLGIQVPEEFGGGGEKSFKFAAVVGEETAAAGVTFGSYSVHTNLILPYLLEYANDEQKQRWLPGFASGDIMFAIAMTEPGTGSRPREHRDVGQAVRGREPLRPQRRKTFITGGALADRILVVCRTAPSTPEDRRAGLTILVVDTASEGFAVGRKIEKIGLQGLRTPPNCPSPTYGARRGPPRRRGGRFQLPHPQPRPGTALHRARRVGHRGRRTAARDRVRQGAQGVRQARRRVPEHEVRARRMRHRGRGDPADGRPRARTARRRRTRRSRTPRRRSCSAPRPRAGSSTSACNCTAATATSSSTRSRACTPTPASPASTAARARS